MQSTGRRDRRAERSIGPHALRNATSAGGSRSESGDHSRAEGKPGGHVHPERACRSARRRSRRRNRRREREADLVERHTQRSADQNQAPHRCRCRRSTARRVLGSASPASLRAGGRVTSCLPRLDEQRRGDDQADRDAFRARRCHRTQDRPQKLRTRHPPPADAHRLPGAAARASLATGPVHGDDLAALRQPCPRERTGDWGFAQLCTRTSSFTVTGRAAKQVFVGAPQLTQPPAAGSHPAYATWLLFALAFAAAAMCTTSVVRRRRRPPSCSRIAQVARTGEDGLRSWQLSPSPQASSGSHRVPSRGRRRA